MKFFGMRLGRRKPEEIITATEESESHIAESQQKLLSFLRLKRRQCHDGLNLKTRKANSDASDIASIITSEGEFHLSLHMIDLHRTDGQQTAFRFFDLPRELQDRIIGYVLAPGEVQLEAYTTRWGFVRPICQTSYRRLAQRLNVPIKDSTLQIARCADQKHLRFPHRRFLKIRGCPSQQQPGFQIMATCKTMYEERHKMFYAQNMFHLQPGPVIITSQYFKRLQPKHRDLIKSIVVTFTIADLTPEGFQYVEDDIAHWKRWFGRSVRSMDKAQQISAWVDASMATLLLLWSRKLQWLLTWPTLEKVELRGGRYKFVIKGSNMAAVFAGTVRPEIMSVFWRSCQSWARKQLKAQYEKCSTVTDSGKMRILKPSLNVEAVKDWLNAQGPGLRCKF